jgi:hypothetical protein
VGTYPSDTYKQDIGVQQGSVLSVTMFIIKINNIVNCLPAGVRGSLFVDNFDLFQIKEHALHRTGTAGLSEDNKIVGR